jgi:hypothetical protein
MTKNPKSRSISPYNSLGIERPAKE